MENRPRVAPPQLTLRRGSIVLLIIAGMVVVLDQWTKTLIRGNIPLNESWLPNSMEWMSRYARLTYIQNSGASFGMFQNGNLILTVLSFLVIGGILYYMMRLESADVWLWIAAGLYLGGALGNLIDRLVVGRVTDFISVGSFYIFNLADASINVSVFIMVVDFLFHERRKRAETSGEVV